MTDYSDRPGGVLFGNKRKTAPNHPDFQGNILLDPAYFEYLMQEYEANRPLKLELTAWKKVGKSGAPFISISSKIPYDAGSAKPKPQQQRQADPWGDDDAPF